MGLTGPIAASVPSAVALPKVPSLLFDMDMEEGMTCSHACEEVDVRVVEQELRSFLRPNCALLLQLTHDVDVAMREQLSLGTDTTDGIDSNRDVPAQTSSRQVDVPTLAKSLTKQGYVACLRRAVGGGEGPSCLQNLRHNFLSVTDSDGTAFVVDPCFTEQFLIAKPTQRYTTILACLPSILILSEDRLAPLVTFLCAELAAAFKDSNTVVPPWRQASSVLSKWKPRNSIDETFRPAAAAGDGRQAQPTTAPPPVTAAQAVQVPRAVDASAPVPVAATQHTRVTVGFAGSKINTSGFSLLKGLLHSN